MVGELIKIKEHSRRAVQPSAVMLYDSPRHSTAFFSPLRNEESIRLWISRSLSLSSEAFTNARCFVFVANLVFLQSDEYKNRADLMK